MTVRLAGWLVPASMAALWCITAQAQTASVWFIPGDNLPRGGKVVASDYMRLFDSSPTWPNAMTHVQVFGMNQEFPARASDNDLRALFVFVRAHHMALDTSLSVLPGRNGCGMNIEGMTNPAVPGAIARRIKQLGGQLDFLAMDEPLMFGHEYAGPNGCRFSIQEVAQGVARTLHDVEAIFPNVQIGDGEPVSHMQGADWLSRVEQWISAYQQAVGKPLAFLQEDPNWNGPWRQRVPLLQAMLQKHGIKYGIMFTAAGTPVSTDEAWVATTQQHIRDYESAIHVPPDQVIFTSWQPRPSHDLPEETPTTVSYLINWYFNRNY